VGWFITPVVLATHPRLRRIQARIIIIFGVTLAMAAELSRAFTSANLGTIRIYMLARVDTMRLQRSRQSIIVVMNLGIWTKRSG
jgi:hypothetical protein